MIEPHQRGLDPQVQAEWERRVGDAQPTQDDDADLLPDGGVQVAQQASDEFLARVGSSDPVDDPLADAETHGGYWGFDVPEDYHNE